MRAARSPWPLPLGGLNAQRSLLSVDNLADAVATVLRAPGALRRAFIVADSERLSLPDMVAAMRRGLGRRPGVLPAPASLLRLALRTMGQEERYQRLAGALVADASALRTLGWTPRVPTPEGLARIMREEA